MPPRLVPGRLLVAGWLAASPVVAHAAPPAWVPVNVAGAPMEDVVEGEVLLPYLELVGAPSDPVAEWWADADDLWLRLQLDNNPAASGTFSAGVYGWLFDTDGNPDDFEHMLLIDAPPGELQVFRNQKLVSAGVGVQPGPVNLVAVGSTYGDVGDGTIVLTEDVLAGVWHLDLQFSRSNLLSVLGVSNDTPFRLALVTGISYATAWEDVAQCADDVTACTSLAPVLSDPLAIDADGDGLSDAEETLRGSPSTDADADDDGLLDGDEPDEDVDADGLYAWEDCDSDNDGVLDGTEASINSTHPDTDVGAACWVGDLDATSSTDPYDADTDDGGLSDGREDWNFNGRIDPWETDPLDPSDDLDSDADGIPDVVEGLADPDADGDDNPFDLDSDGDGIPDAIEGVIDTDGDGTPDFLDDDSDGDGVPDADEGDGDADGDDVPDYLDPDSDGDGVPDSEEGDGDSDCDGVIDRLDPIDDGPCPKDTDADADTDTDADADTDTDVDTDTDADTDGPPVDTQDPVPDTGDPQTYFSGGSFTGGACATTQWPGGAAAVAAMLLVARRRRRAAVVAVAVGVAPSAAAQEIDAQRFSPSVDGYDTLVVEDTEIAPAGSFGGGLWANYADDPFVYRYDGGEIAVLDDVTTADAVVFYSLGPARFGVDVPVHLATDGFGVTRALNMGDLRLAAKGRLLSRASAPVGLALSAEATLPTANRGNWVGAGATTVGVSASASRALGPVALVAELGVQTGTGEVLDDALRATAALDGGLGVSVRPIDELWFIAEIDGAWWLGNPGAPGAAPVEWRVAARGAPAGDLLLTAGVGSGLSRGVGAPDVRVFGALTWTPGPGRVTLDDPDGDGIVGVADRCPDEAEDVNGTADDDGCPDGAGQVATTFWVSDRYDTPLAGARLELTSGPKTGSWTTGSDGSLGMALPPGNYRVSAEMASYAPATLDLTLAGPSQSVVLQLLPPTDVGKVTVRVVGPSGRAVPRAEVRVLGTLGQPLVTGADGILEASLSTGAYEVTVAAEGWVAQTRGIKVSPTSAADLTVVLMPEEVTIDAEAKQIYLHKKVFFELEKAELLVESYKVLDALVEVLVDHPEIRKIRVEGHTDTQGTDAYNQELSESRAAAVGAYLVKAGIKQDRIETVGLGESRTLQSGDSEDVHATNRRVEVHILEITEKP